MTNNTLRKIFFYSYTDSSKKASYFPDIYQNMTSRIKSSINYQYAILHYAAGSIYAPSQTDHLQPQMATWISTYKNSLTNLPDPPSTYHLYVCKDSRCQDYMFEIMSPLDGYIQIYKEAQEINSRNNIINLSVEGAKFKVFDTKSAAQQQVAYNLSPSTIEAPSALATLTIDSSSYSNKYRVSDLSSSKTLYVVESSSPTYINNSTFKWLEENKTTIYEITVTSSNTESKPAIVNTINYYKTRGKIKVKKEY